MKRKLTRRQLAAGLAAAPAVLGAAGPPARVAEKHPLAAARKQVDETCRKLARFQLSLSAQPAFIFKP